MHIMRRHAVTSIIALICIALTLNGAIPVGFAYADSRHQTYIVTILSADDPQGFTPAILSAHPNDIIRFVNDDKTPRQIIVANVTSPTIAAGQRWDFTAPAKGIYLYQDSTNQMLVGNLDVVSATDQFISQIKPDAPQTLPFLVIGALILGLLLLALVFVRLRRFRPTWISSGASTSTSDVTITTSANDDSAL